MVDYFRVPGIAGDQSVREISEAVNKLPGVLLVSVDPSERTVRVEHVGIRVAEILKAIKLIGYDKAMVLV